MAQCEKCGKKVGIFSGVKFLDSDNKRKWACGDCYSKINEKRYKEKKDEKTKVKEIKCTCKQCSHIWHYLEKEEKELEKQSMGNALVGCGMCCNPFGAFFLNKSMDKSREAEKLSKCPKCGTGNITKKEIYYD